MTDLIDSMRFLKAVVVLLSLPMFHGCHGTFRIAENAADRAAVLRVVDSFRDSIIQKDKATFTSLFFSDKQEAVTWQAVVDDASLQTIRSKRPEAIKARHRPDNNFIAFIDGVVASDGREEETFTDVHVDTDGEVASVSFDYVYLSHSKPTNNGREKWLLVRTEQGWKIISVVYTVRLLRTAEND